MNGASMILSTIQALFRRARQRGEEATAAVELAFVLPLLATLLCGAIDFGRIFYAYIAVSSAAHEAAVYASRHVTDSNGTFTLPDSATLLTIATGESGGALTSANTTVASVSQVTGTAVTLAQVKLTYSFMPLAALPLRGPIVMAVTAAAPVHNAGAPGAPAATAVAPTMTPTPGGPTSTPTATPLPLTPTSTVSVPTATATASAPTSTATTPATSTTVAASPTAAGATATAAASQTPLPTATLPPPTATSTRTNTPVPPTATTAGTNTPTHTPTATATSVPSCTVPNLVGLHPSVAQPAWTQAGFTGAFTDSTNGNPPINQQSLPAGSAQACTSSITVS